MVLQKFHILISLPPIVVELTCFFLIDVVVMISLFIITTILLPHNFSTFVIKHAFLGNSVHPRAIFVSLLFLRDSVTIFMLAHTVLKIVLLNNFAIRTHFARAHKTLANIGASGAFAVHIFVHIRELENILKRVCSEGHHISKERVTSEATEAPHKLVHVGEGVMHVHPCDLLAMAVSSSAHCCLAA